MRPIIICISNEKDLEIFAGPDPVSIKIQSRGGIDA